MSVQGTPFKKYVKLILNTIFEKLDGYYNKDIAIFEIGKTFYKKDEDYKEFYRELYPMQFEDPLFNIHLNVDYPFNLTGILYFPKFHQFFPYQKVIIFLEKTLF